MAFKVYIGNKATAPSAKLLEALAKAGLLDSRITWCDTEPPERGITLLVNGDALMEAAFKQKMYRTEEVK